MILKLLNWIAKHRASRRIEAEDGALYLLRVKVWGWMPKDPKKYFTSAYLHRFFLPDLDRDLHNHPWKWSVSFILAGGYEEERLVGAKFVPCMVEGIPSVRSIGGRIIKRRLRPFTLNILGPNDFHRVTRLCGSQSWSFFLAGRKFKGWGFRRADGVVVPHTLRFKERGIPREEGA